MENSAAEAEMRYNISTAFDNLENTVVLNNNTVKRLVIANKSLTDSLTARDVECARHLTIINDLSTGPGASSGGGGKPPWEPDGYYWSNEYKVRNGHIIAT